MTNQAVRWQGISNYELELYLENWRDHEGYSDFNLMIDKGYLKLASKLLVNAGVINSVKCDDQCKPIEAYIEGFSQFDSEMEFLLELDRFMDGVEIWINASKQHYFIDHSIHFVTDIQLIEWGFKRIA